MNKEDIEVRNPKLWPPDKQGSYWCVIEGIPKALGMMLVRLEYGEDDLGKIGFLQEDDNFRVLYYLTNGIPEAGQQVSKGEVEECSHEPLIDTGVGYYFCPACKKSWTYNEWNKPAPVPSKRIYGPLYDWGHGFDAAITLANNICVNKSDEYNNDDFIKEADATSQLAKEIRKYHGDRSYKPEDITTPSNQPEENKEVVYPSWVKALEEIVNPIPFMKERLKDGEKLDGTYAVMLSKDAEYLRSIAKKALEQSPTPEERRFTLDEIKDIYKQGHVDGMSDSEDIEMGYSPRSEPEKYFKEKFGINL